ncbi:MAG: hypothetical protein LBH00_05055 [Planctomycetaceae bacterium]|jgi:hypothetical protein|nr:hypothetical protein [Planctomycetaceae bacterium]
MKRFRLIVVCFLGLFAAGCSRDIPAGGVVVYSDGTPLEKGLVLLSDGKFMYRGNITDGGVFKLGGLKQGNGLPAGTYKVTIGGANEYEYTESRNPQIDYDKSVLRIDPKYENPQTSGLTVDVKKGMSRITLTVDRYPIERANRK